MRYKENYRSIERQCFFFIFFFAKIKLLFLLSLPLSRPLSSPLFLSLSLFLTWTSQEEKVFFCFFRSFFFCFLHSFSSSLSLPP